MYPKKAVFFLPAVKFAILKLTRFWAEVIDIELCAIICFFLILRDVCPNTFP